MYVDWFIGLDQWSESKAMSISQFFHREYRGSMLQAGGKVSFPLVSDTSLHSPAAPSLVPALQTSHPLDYVVPLFPSTGLSAASVLFLSFSL